MGNVIVAPPSLLRRAWRMTFGHDRRRRLRELLFPRQADIVDGKWTRWSRVVMDRETHNLVNALNPWSLDALEISGSDWKEYGFKNYRHVDFPEYDLCKAPLPERFDLVIAEQVFEHVLWPYRSGRHVCQMLRPGGHFLISVPFLVKVHNWPVDCSRWTELGLKHFLAECGFELETIQTGSWGNRKCILAHFNSARPLTYREKKHSLENEPEFPHHVWALARKPLDQPTDPSK
jgi:SAM-dependent methyltransferase